MPAYMSPEQIRAERVVDARSDVWSLGVILVRDALGVLPAPVLRRRARSCRIVTEPPVPLLTSLPGALPELAAIVERCLRTNQRTGTPAPRTSRDIRASSSGRRRPSRTGSDAATACRALPTMAARAARSRSDPGPRTPSSRARGAAARTLVVGVAGVRSAVSVSNAPASRVMHQPQIPSQDDYGDISTDLIPLSGRISLAEDPRVRTGRAWCRGPAWRAPARDARHGYGESRGGLGPRPRRDRRHVDAGAGDHRRVMPLSRRVAGRLLGHSARRRSDRRQRSSRWLACRAWYWRDHRGSARTALIMGLLLAGPGLIADASILAGFIFPDWLK